MLYFLAEWIKNSFDPPGFGLFQYITVRAALAAISSLIVSLFFGKTIINWLINRGLVTQAKQELENVGTHAKKSGIPIMGGLIVLSAILIPTLLWADIANAYVILIMITTAWLGGVGFLDDYLKAVKKYPKGLIGKYKIVGQVGIGLVLGGLIYFAPHIFSSSFAKYHTMTTIPFQKNLNFDFGILYIPVIIFILTATSNAVNLTDGLDGLAIGTVGIASLAFVLIAYVSGNAKYADYLNIMHLQGSGELAVFAAAMVGASLGFLWYNSYPAQVIMGDTGSLALGGAIGGLAILIKKEFLLPILGGIFFAETLSVIIQVSYFKYTKKKYGTGKRIFRMSPVHHHFEKSGWHESKIVSRFYIIAIMLAIITLATFKVR